jgi:hypothetical protein
MVTAVRAGQSLRQVARRFRVGVTTVLRWVRRAIGQRLDRVDWSDGSRAPQHTGRTDKEMEDRVLRMRDQLRASSDLGQFGARAIHHALLAGKVEPLPSIRTIGRILHRRGALDGRRRVRRPAPPPGWYLPEVEARAAELDSFDNVEGLVIRGGVQVEVLNGISLHGGLVVSFAQTSISAKSATDCILQHWKECGLPRYAQFDNDTCFQGAHQHRDVISRVMRLCLSLQVVPVFVPPREPGFQALIENYNGWWQAKVWARFAHANLQDVRERSARYVQASRRLRASRIEAAPTRLAVPTDWKLDLQARPHGQIVFLRRTNDQGEVYLLGRTFLVDALWLHRLVRAEVLLDAGEIRFYALRRADPHTQPLLRTSAWQLPVRNRKFRE